MKLVGVLVVAGWSLLTVAAALFSIPLGVAVAGIGCLWVARQVA